MNERLPTSPQESRFNPRAALASVVIAACAYLAVGSDEPNPVFQPLNSGEIFSRLTHPVQGIQFPIGK